MKTTPGPKQGETLPKDPNPNDGYPPKFKKAPPAANVDTSTFKTVTRSGTKVPLVPLDVAYNWYTNRKARFADARSPDTYKASHIFAAVNSPAPSGKKKNDPIANWPKSDPIVCYCNCPHYLSSVRAGYLLRAGYKEVYALGPGFRAWNSAKYPVAGTSTNTKADVRTITGTLDTKYAGKGVWAIDTVYRQMEAGAIQSNGDFRLDLKFRNVNAQTPIRIRSPAYTITKPLGVLVNGHLTPDGRVVS